MHPFYQLDINNIDKSQNYIEVAFFSFFPFSFFHIYMFSDIDI